MNYSEEALNKLVNQIDEDIIRHRNEGCTSCVMHISEDTYWDLIGTYAFTTDFCMYIMFGKVAEYKNNKLYLYMKNKNHYTSIHTIIDLDDDDWVELRYTDHMVEGRNSTTIIPIEIGNKSGIDSDEVMKFILNES